MPYIKLLTALAGLALLTACGGGTAETPDTAGGNATDCKTNAFHADCNADAPAIELRQSMCLADDSADSTCGVVITGACTANPFRTETACMADTYNPQRQTACESGMPNRGETACEPTIARICTNGDIFDDFCTGLTGIDTMRASICQTHGTDPTDGHSTCATILIPLCVIADPFAHAGCDSVVGINAGVRKTFCETPANAWNPKCMDTTHGAVNATRITACQMFGTGMGGDDSCATSLASACTITNPFIHEGCDDVAGIDAGLRTMFCEMPANAWNPKCMDTMHGAVTATRVTACQMFGTGMGGDDSCATSLATVCNDIANPFIHEGCDDVVGIDAGVRTMYCEMEANAWNPKCMDGMHGTVASFRTIACLDSPFNDLADPLCAMDTGAETACGLNPFDSANPGCRNLDDYKNIVGTYCTTINPSADECRVKTSAWVESFGEGKAPPARLDNTNRKSEFLAGLATGLDTTGATPNGIPNGANLTLTLDSARYNGEPLGGAGDEKDGYGLFYDNTDDSNNRVYYAGILADTDLGAPLTQTTGSVTWYGQIQIIRDGALDTTSAHNFELEITFGGTNGVAGSIEGEDVERVLSGFTYQYRLAGTYDAGGVITGTVTHESFTGADTGQLSRATPNGILTGLIGEQGAVGVFLAADAGSTKDNIINTENANGRYVGGFVVAPAPPPPNACIALTTCVDTGDLPTYETKPNEETLNRFLTAGNTGLNMTDIQFENSATRIISTDIPPFTGRRGGEGRNPDGFAYFVTTNAGEVTTEISYAGILATTNLGAPLPSTTASAVWEGHFSLGAETNIATNYYVNFSTGRFGFSNAGGDGFGTFEHDNINGIYTMNAHFGSHASANGYSAGRMGGTLAISGVGSAFHPDITGLIGEEGVVGIFTKVGSASASVGGFTATNPAYTPPE